MMGGLTKNPKLLLGLVVGIGVLAIALLVSTIVLGVRLNNKSNELKDLQKDSHPKICNTKECVKAAGKMLEAMDLSVNPCDDFYAFSCAAWIEKNPIPDTSSSWNQFNVLREELSRDVRGILEREISQELDPNPVQLAKQFYMSCMQQNTTNESELYNLIEVDLVIDEARNDLGLKAAQLRREIGGAFFANMYVELDEENASNYTIYVDQPSIGLNRAFLVNLSHPTRQAYRDLIQEVWPILYPEETNSPSIIADAILEFETELAEASTPPEKRRNRTELYNLMTLVEFSSHTINATSFNWERYVTEVFKDAVRDHNLDLGPLPELKLVIRDPSYFTKFGHVLSQTNMDTIVNYLRWRLIFGLGYDVSGNLRQVFFEFVRKTQGIMYPSPRWKDCSERANAFFGMAVSYHYVQEALGGDFEEQMGEMIRNIQDSVYETIDTVDWIGSTETRDKAKEKARKMKEFIGYPNWLTNNSTALDFYYKGLALTLPSNHFKNVLEVSYWRNMESLRRLRNAKDTDRWTTDPTVVNAFYSSTYNSISFPAGILQAPFYFTGNPIQALNYGAVGMVIGHEISHGFDDRGRQSDGDGNLINWWDELTISNYLERARCFINQYGEYSAEEANNLKLNGNTTLGENIADNGGLRQSYNAYKAFVKKHGSEPYLPGLEYTPEQLFFVAFAQIWCGAYTPQGMENQILTGAHSPNRFRVRGVLQNSREFAETWNCPLQDESSICRIW